jgi:hypothetical protein
VDDDWHIPPQAVQRFLKAQVSRTEATRIAVHLFGGCDRCIGLVQRCVDASGAWRAVEVTPAGQSRTFREPLAPQERMARLLADQGLHTREIHRQLLEASLGYMRASPARAAEIVQLAVTLAERADPRRIGGAKARQDMLAEAYAALGNVKRVGTDFTAARQDLDQAWTHAGAGTGSPFTSAWIASFDSSWKLAMGEIVASVEMLEPGLLFYHSEKARHQEGRLRIQMGAAIGNVDLDRGIRYLREGMRLIDRDREPRLELIAQYCLGSQLVAARRAEEARSSVNQARPLLRQFSDPWPHSCLRWIEGNLALVCGKLEDAESLLGQVRRDLQRQNLRLDFVLVTLNLAEARLAAGALHEAAALAAETYSTLAGWRVHRQALAAWRRLWSSLEHERNANLIPRAKDYFGSSWFSAAEFT